MRFAWNWNWRYAVFEGTLVNMKTAAMPSVSLAIVCSWRVRWVRNCHCSTLGVFIVGENYHGLLVLSIRSLYGRWLDSGTEKTKLSSGKICNWPTALGRDGTLFLITHLSLVSVSTTLDDGWTGGLSFGIGRCSQVWAADIRHRCVIVPVPRRELFKNLIFADRLRPWVRSAYLRFPFFSWLLKRALRFDMVRRCRAIMTLKIPTKNIGNILMRAAWIPRYKYQRLKSNPNDKP